MLGISRDTLYDWINSGQVAARFDRRDRRVFDGAQFGRVGELLRERQIRRKIRDHLLRRGKTAAAAKKFIYRQRKAGISFEQILTSLTCVPNVPANPVLEC